MPKTAQIVNGACLVVTCRTYAGTIAKYSKTLTLTGEAVSKGYVYIPETEAERLL